MDGILNIDCSENCLGKKHALSVSTFNIGSFITRLGIKDNLQVNMWFVAPNINSRGDLILLVMTITMGMLVKSLAFTSYSSRVPSLIMCLGNCPCVVLHGLSLFVWVTSKISGFLLLSGWLGCLNVPVHRSIATLSRVEEKRHLCKYLYGYHHLYYLTASLWSECMCLEKKEGTLTCSCNHACCNKHCVSQSRILKKAYFHYLATDLDIITNFHCYNSVVGGTVV